MAHSLTIPNTPRPAHYLFRATRSSIHEFASLSRANTAEFEMARNSHSAGRVASQISDDTEYHLLEHIGAWKKDRAYQRDKSSILKRCKYTSLYRDITSASQPELK